MYDWVLANGPEHWANSQFKRKRWDKLSSDETDAFNSWMSNEWQMPVLEFIKAHQCKLADLLSSRRRDNLNWKGPVGSAIEMRIRENMSKAQNLVIRQVSNFAFEIQLQSSLTVVDLTRMVCSCLEWQMTGIPCTHACKALQLVNLDVYQFVDKWYHRETQEIIYEESMLVVSLNDIPTTGDGSNTKDGVPFELQPPVMMPARGRPRGMPIRTRSSPTCSNCNEAGHNRKTCKMSQDNL
ncbi:Protein FAR1-RELATED SEQUENCE like [Quillaja saponaria]|uniref:Protein FAR1-RELATED SEQUENCE like n=1 Tax=Quillaja saponaria TaxID=32244 RepID=A0AAD7VIS8_QUISA|nr:Protein FAR1-RELATED SEQUENCE like [Quillaja saponaria]